VEEEYFNCIICGVKFKAFSSFAVLHCPSRFRRDKRIDLCPDCIERLLKHVFLCAFFGIKGSDDEKEGPEIEQNKQIRVMPRWWESLQQYYQKKKAEDSLGDTGGINYACDKVFTRLL